MAVREWHQSHLRIIEAEKLVIEAMRIAGCKKTAQAAAAAEAAIQALEALDGANDSEFDEPGSEDETEVENSEEDVRQFFENYDVRDNSAPSLGNNTFGVTKINGGQSYTVIHWPDHSWQCTCADFRFRRRACKHIRCMKKGLGEVLGCTMA
jgi:hypothetical protein